MGTICGLFGKTRQGWYKQVSSGQQQDLADAIIIGRVKGLRKAMPGLGTRKLHYLLTPLLQQHGINIGRDKLFDLLADSGLLIRKRRRRRTTNANHPYLRYPNLIKEMEVSAAGQLWVSDITYISLKEDFGYLSLVTDAYSRKIVGYCLYPSLKAEGPLQALSMALRQYDPGQRLIHHSDRGVQYCCSQYVTELKTRDIAMSMTENGDPYENAIAERVNGILKSEFGLDRYFDSPEQAAEAVDTAVSVYNTMRPHASCDYMTPDQAHSRQGKLRRRWKPKVRAPALQMLEY
jgi:putative transposase